MTVRSKILGIIIGIQLCAILVLSISIFSHLKRSVSVNPIPSLSITMNSGSMLAHYYEPVPGDTIADRKSWMTEEAIYTINKDGLNERFDYPVHKKPGVYRIMTLGDSFTFGTNVSTAENWTESLEDILNRSYRCKGVLSYEVINLGVGGYDIRYESERFRRKGIKYNGDLLIWHITDIYRLTGEMLPQLKLTDDEKKKGAFLPKWLDIRKKTLDVHGRETILNFQRTTVRNTLKTIPGKTLFVDNPIPYRSEKVKGIHEAHLVGPDDEVFTPSFSIGEGQYSLEDQHYNKLGHQTFAQELAVFLNTRGLTPCKKKI